MSKVFDIRKPRNQFEKTIYEIRHNTDYFRIVQGKKIEVRHEAR